MQLKIDEQSVANINKQFLDIQRNLQKTADSNYINLKINSGDLNKNISSANSSLKEATTNTKSFGNEIGSVIKRSAEWMLALIGIRSVIKEIGDGLSFVNSVDTKLTDIAMITGKNKAELQEYAKAWNQTAIDMKTTTSNVIDANEEYLRAGKSIDEANKLVETNIKLARISNDTNEDTADNLIKLSNAYNLNAEGVDKFANKVAYLDSATATNSKDLLTSATYMAGVAQQTGMSLDFMLASLATIQERSKQAPESIARNYRSMLENMQKVTQDGGAELSKLEGVLNKNGVAIRNNAREFKSSEEILKSVMQNYKNWDDVTKSQVGNLIAGKNAMEVFNALMLNQDRLQENYNNALNATNNLNEKYQEHLDSTVGKENELRAKSEKLWLSLFNSSAINGVITGLSSIVTVTNRVVNELGTFGTAVTVLTTAMILLKSKAIGGLITDFVAICTGETLATSATVGLSLAVEALGASMLALLSNPVTWIIAACGAVVGGIIAVSNHQQKLKEETDSLSSSYKSLTQAMAENDVQAMKDNYDKLADKEKQLQDLLKQRETLESKLGNGNFDSKGTLNATQSQLNSVNNQIATLQKELDGAGVSTEKLAQAQLQIKNNDIADNIKKQADAEVQNKQLITQLITEYQNLNAVQDKNSTQKERMTQLANDLSDKISGLTLETDKNGNVTIQNTDLLGKEITILNTEGNTVQTLTNVKLTAARDASSAQIGETTMTYTEIKKRLDMYDAEATALANLKAQQTNLDNAMGQGKTYNFATGKFDESPMATLLDEATKAQNENHQAMVNAKNALDKIYGTGSTNTSPSSTGNANGNGGYIPEGNGSSSTKKSDTTTIKAMDDYTREIASNNEEISKAEKNITSLQNTEKQYADNKDYQNALKTDNNLLKEQTDYQTLLKAKLTEANTMKSQVASQLNGLGITNSDMSSPSQLQAIYDARYANRDLTKEQQAQADILKTAIDRWNAINTQIDSVNDKIDTSSTKIQDINNDITTINTSLKQQAQDQLNNIQSVEDEIVKALKQSYQDELDAFTTAHQAKLDALDKEKSAYDDLISAQEKALENEESEYDYNKSLSDLQSSKNDLQAQYNSLLLDNSDEAKSMREDLAKQIADKRSSIEDSQYKHSIDTQKSALEDQKSNYDDSIQDQIDSENTAYDNYKTIMDNKMKDQNLLAEAQTALQTQSFSQLSTMLTTYEDQWGQGLSATGDQIKSQLIDNLEKAQESAKNLSSIMTTLGVNGTVNASTGNSSSSTSVVSNPIAGATYTAGSNPYSYTVHFGNGGMTGNWSDGDNDSNGKLAVVHPNEAIENPIDTQLLLQATDVSRSILSMVPNISTPKLSSINNTTSGDVIFKFDNLINVEGNLDKTVMPDAQSLAGKVMGELKGTYDRRGTRRFA